MVGLNAARGTMFMLAVMEQTLTLIVRRVPTYFTFGEFQLQASYRSSGKCRIGSNKCFAVVAVLKQERTVVNGLMTGAMEYVQEYI